MIITDESISYSPDFDEKNIEHLNKLFEEPLPDPEFSSLIVGARQEQTAIVNRAFASLPDLYALIELSTPIAKENLADLLFHMARRYHVDLYRKTHRLVPKGHIETLEVSLRRVLKVRSDLMSPDIFSLLRPFSGRLAPETLDSIRENMRTLDGNMYDDWRGDVLPASSITNVVVFLAMEIAKARRTQHAVPSPITSLVRACIVMAHFMATAYGGRLIKVERGAESDFAQLCNLALYVASGNSETDPDRSLRKCLRDLKVHEVTTEPYFAYILQKVPDLDPEYRRFFENANGEICPPHLLEHFAAEHAAEHAAGSIVKQHLAEDAEWALQNVSELTEGDKRELARIRKLALSGPDIH